MSLLLLLLACQTDPAPEAGSSAPTGSAPVVVYSGRGESLVGGLFERLETETGVDVEVRYGDTPELVTLLMTEGAESPADIIFAQDSGHLGALADRDLLAAMDEALLAPVDARFRDPARRWVGTSGRARVLVYNTESLGPDTLPRTLAELADPKWGGKLGWAPGNGSFQSHVSALRHLWGEEETRKWLADVAKGEPVVYPKNSPQVAAAAKGDIQIGWVNHYYLHKKKTEGFTADNWSLPTDGDAGNVLMLAGMAIREGTPRMDAAQKVVGWMLSESAQNAFAQDNFEYPTRTGVGTHADVPPLSELHLATVEQAWLSDLGPTRAMLQDLGLL